MEKLTPKNCEWTMRPKVALSEAAQALRENWEIIKNSELIDANIRDTMNNIMAPMAETLANVDMKEKTTHTSDTDIYNVMNWCFQHQQLDGSLAKWMQESAAMLVFVTQLRAMTTIIANPQQYASKLINDTPEALQFKTVKSIPALQ